MAQETKVGLLAGLAFIVCFAVILTNRGNERFNNENLGARPDLPPVHSEPQQRQTPDTSRIVQSDPGAPRAVWQRRPDARDAVQESDPTTATRPDAGTPLKPEGYLANRGIADSNADHTWTSASRDRLERRLDELAAEVNRQRRADSADTHERAGAAADLSRPWTDPVSPPGVLSAESARQRADQRDLQYTVVSGDSLSKIARLFYGTGSRTVVNAIFDANRAVLPGVDQLRAGLKITLPTVAGIDGPRGVSAHPAPPSPAAGQNVHRREESGPRDTRWYEIQKNDRYAKIAREQLGDESRWREIFELNKDKFPKPDMIRPGVRIKLPSRRVASAGSGRH